MTEGDYLNHHFSQFDRTNRQIVRSQGCTPTTGSNGADASTGGRVIVTPDELWDILPPEQQTNPNTPGWSLVDLDNAMARVGVPFTNRSGKSWSALLDALNADKYVALQGDCDQLGGCSGFMGDHCLGIHPQILNGLQRCDEPTRLSANFYSLSQLKNYAVKLSGNAFSIYFGVFENTVPAVGVNMSRFVQSNGYGVASSKLVTVPKDAKWNYLDGTPGGSFSVAQKVQVFGIIDGKVNHYLCAISTEKPYPNDTVQRTTLIEVVTTQPLENVPALPSNNDLEARQEQWDKDAASVLGQRPTV